MIVLMFAFIYLVNFYFENLDPNSTDTILLAEVVCLLVFLGSIILMVQQIREKQQIILQLVDDKEKMKRPILEIISTEKQQKSLLMKLCSLKA